jgi:hypothetical protein
MKKTTTFALIAGASALAAASAFAEHHEKKEGMDWEAKLEAKFAEVDANGDGSVTADEFRTYKLEQAEKEWAAWTEGDADGMVSLEEAKAHHKAKMAEKAAKKEQKGDH